MSSPNNDKRLPRFCPVSGKEIEMDICFDICLVAEGASPLNELPIGMKWSKELEERCMNCREHIE